MVSCHHAGTNRKNGDAAEERKGTHQEARSKARSAERKLQRFPLAGNDLPPNGRVVAIRHGLAVFEDVTGELIEPEIVGESIPVSLMITYGEFEAYL
jgi:hypothetical protein